MAVIKNPKNRTFGAVSLGGLNLSSCLAVFASTAGFIPLISQEWSQASPSCQLQTLDPLDRQRRHESASPLVREVLSPNEKGVVTCNETAQDKG